MFGLFRLAGSLCVVYTCGEILYKVYEKINKPDVNVDEFKKEFISEYRRQTGMEPDQSIINIAARGFLNARNPWLTKMCDLGNVVGTKSGEQIKNAKDIAADIQSNILDFIKNFPKQ